jgi:hypothetical protein
MATLKEIKGTTIQFLDADPVVYVGAWSSGGTMNTTTRYISAGAGTNTAGIAFGGQSPVTANTELYDGSSWTEVNNLNTARSYLGGAGTQTAALAICGGPSPPYNNVESWDGTNWTEIAEVNSGGNAYGSGSCGTQTAALITMRITSPNALTELWNGSAWTEVNDMNTAREGGAVCGVSTSAIAGGGATVTNSESWNGSSWTEVSEINTARQTLGGSGSSNTDGLIFGGNQPGGTGGATPAVLTESWNGTSWTEVADLATTRYGGGAGKTGSSSTSSFLSGGNTGTANTGVTEEWSFPPVTASVVQEGQMWFNSSSSALKGYGTAAGIPSTTWASGANINTARGIGVGVGKTTAGLIWGGYNGSQVTLTESYNGTAWTEVNDLRKRRIMEWIFMDRNS